jgi:hypothetical protein
MFNPYVLGLAIDDFRFEIKNWTYRIREYVSDARYELNNVAELSNRMRDKVTYVQGETDKDTEQVSEYGGFVSDSRAVLNKKSALIGNWDKYMQKVDSIVSQHKLHWEQELSSAQRWVSDAQRAVDVAQARVDKARYELQNAIDAYNRAARDDKRNTTSEERRLSEARREAELALALLASAQADLMSAVARADSCKKALGVIKEATAKVIEANGTLNDVYRSYGESDSAQTLAETMQYEAGNANIQEISATESAHSHASHAEQDVADATQLFNKIVGYEQESQSRSDSAIRAMEYRIEKLQMLDYPDLTV